MTVAGRDVLAADLAGRVFAAPQETQALPPRVGAEVELIPVDFATRRRCRILPFLRCYAERAGWREERGSKGGPCFLLPGGGTVTFEPGGQVEYSSPPVRSASALLLLLEHTVMSLRTAAAAEGIDLLTVGIDPFNPIGRAPLVLRGKRYVRMSRYFARRHPAGARMMRQTAAFHLNLDLGGTPALRWRVLNAAAPYFVAIFANSALYAGAPAGGPSARAQVWRALDPTRTGLPYAERDPIGAYLDFALEAPAMLLPEIDGQHRSFGEWLERGTVTTADWDEHLSTLFPEVRPRGRFELRSCDAIAPAWYAAPLVLAVGIAYAPAALDAALDLLGAPDGALLERASRAGLRDDAIARTAGDLVDIALRGCASLGGYFDPAALERAEEFFDCYTRQARAPADDMLDEAIAAWGCPDRCANPWCAGNS